VGVVSPARIIKRLIPGDYSTASGYPGAEEQSEWFVEEVRARVPELVDLPDEEVEEKALDALEWAVRETCRQVEWWEHSPETGAHVGLYLYACEHPETGRYYMVVHEEHYSDIDEHYVGFTLTRSYGEARRAFRDLVRDWEERLAD